MQAADITISIIIVIARILLTLVLLVHKSKGGGLGASFAAGNQTLGVRPPADFLEKLNWGLAIAVLALCIVATFVVPGRPSHKSQVKEKIEQTAPTSGQPEFPANTIPAQQPTE